MFALPRFLAAGALSVLLAACVAPTPYAPTAEAGSSGYGEQRIDATTWRISFAGNAATPREQVENYLLYRAAEVATEAGAKTFVILDQSVERNVSYRGQAYPGYIGRHGLFSFGRRGFHRRHGFLPYGYARLSAVNRYRAFALIRVFDDKAPEGLGVAYDAAEVLATLGPAVIRPTKAQN